MVCLLSSTEIVLDATAADIGGSADRGCGLSELERRLRADGAAAARAKTRRVTNGEEIAMLAGHQPADALIEALRRDRVRYELVPHRRTETALDEAEALHVDPREVAKTLILATPFGLVRAVLRACDRLDLEKARVALNTESVALADESTLIGSYPQFEVGAVPPVGGPYDRVVVDARLFDRTSVVLDAGAHDESIRIRTSDLLSVAEAELADLAEDYPNGGAPEPGP
jgi:Ala-tRNA(Pro) deacylase